MHKWGLASSSTLWQRRATDHGSHCRLVSDHKTGWRLVEPLRSRWWCHQLAEDDSYEGTRKMNELQQQWCYNQNQNCSMFIKVNVSILDIALLTWEDSWTATKRNARKWYCTLAPVNVRSCNCAFRSLFICRSSRAYEHTRTKYIEYNRKHLSKSTGFKNDNCLICKILRSKELFSCIFCVKNNTRSNWSHAKSHFP